MKISTSFIITISLALAGCGTMATRGNYFGHRGEPENLDDHKARLAEYYRKDYARQVGDALAFARERIADARARDQKTVVVFDFAEVLMSNWDYQREYQMGFRYSDWKKHVDRADAPAVPGIVEFYRWCRERGADTLIASGRAREAATVEREPSVINLRKLGILDYDIVWIEDDEKKDRGAFKKRVRDELYRKGYELVVNIGSQERDFFAETRALNIKLPNPFYRAPSRIEF